MSEERAVTRRRVPGTTVDTSVLGVDLDGRALGSTGDDERNVAVLRKARSFGMTTFAVGEGAAGARAERLLALALPNPDPELLIIARRSLGPLASERSRASAGSDLEERLRASLAESSERLSPHSIGLLEWRNGADAREDVDVVPALERMRSNGLIVDVLTPATRAIELWARPNDDATGPTLVVGPLSLLDVSLVPAVRARADVRPVGVFVRDPLAEGRLDGSRFDRTVAERGPGTPPPTLRELQREFAPVLELGFLSSGRRRTLLQASVQFVAAWPWVCSMLVPLPRPERLGELADATVSPQLSEEEVARVLALDARASAGAPSRGGLK